MLTLEEIARHILDQVKVSCSERYRLLDECQSATKALQRLVLQLPDLIGADSPLARGDRQMRYQAITPMVAVRLHATPDQRTIVTLPTGTVFETFGEPDAAGLIHIKHRDEALAVFARDLDDRADVIEEAISALEGFNSP